MSRCAKCGRSSYINPMTDEVINNCICDKPQPKPKTVVPDTLTLRDQFAMSALQGILSTQNIDSMCYSHEDVVKGAYKVADIMLNVRQN